MPPKKSLTQLHQKLATVLQSCTEALPPLTNDFVCLTQIFILIGADPRIVPKETLILLGNHYFPNAPRALGPAVKLAAQSAGLSDSAAAEIVDVLEALRGAADSCESQSHLLNLPV
jgi:hypothetical protein